MIIMLCSQKGGCGKSTVAINFSAFLVSLGKDVILVDSDKQGTASNWVSDRNEKEEVRKVNSVQKFENIRDTILDLRKRYQYVIVDSPGRDCREMRTGVSAADILVVPFRCSQPDLDTLPTMQEILSQGKDINPNMQIKALLTMVPTNPKIKEFSESADYLMQYPDFHLMKSVFYDRKIYRDSLGWGLGVHELKNKKARSEIECFTKEVLCQQ